MTLIPPSAGTATRRNHRFPVVGLIIVIAVITAAIAYPVLRFSSSASSSLAPSLSTSASSPPFSALDAGSPIVTPPVDHQPAGRESTHDADGGAVPDGVTVFDDAYPAVAKLDPELLRALREAATAAAGDGVRFYVSSGWRSPERQNQLLREAVSKYGSEAKAARWVATADTSPHVTGDAIDIGRAQAAAWLSEHGAEYDLCQIYRNEPWHYELRRDAIDHDCPRMYADPTQDPRMHR